MADNTIPASITQTDLKGRVSETKLNSELESTNKHHLCLVALIDDSRDGSLHLKNKSVSETTKELAKVLAIDVKEWDPESRIEIIHYGGEHEEPAAFAKHHRLFGLDKQAKPTEITSAIDGLKPNGGSPFPCALRLAVADLAKIPDTESKAIAVISLTEDSVNRTYTYKEHTDYVTKTMPVQRVIHHYDTCLPASRDSNNRDTTVTEWVPQTVPVTTKEKVHYVNNFNCGIELYDPYTVDPNNAQNPIFGPTRTPDNMDDVVKSAGETLSRLKTIKPKIKSAGDENLSPANRDQSGSSFEDEN